MSCEDLVCAGCAHPVAEGRCPAVAPTASGCTRTASASMALALISLALIALFFLTLALKHLTSA